MQSVIWTREEVGGDHKDGMRRRSCHRSEWEIRSHVCTCICIHDVSVLPDPTMRHFRAALLCHDLHV